MDIQNPAVAVLLLLLSPAIGSFLGVVIDRYSRGESIVRPRSFCRACGTTLGVRDLIPVLSFAATRGRCRHCGAAIPPWLLYVEIAAIGAACLAVAAGGSAGAMALAAVYLCLLLALGVSDLLWMRLPDPLTAALLATALGSAALPGGASLGAAALGAVIGSGSFFGLRLAYRAVRGREGLGLGDVKLMAGIGAGAGALALPALILVACLIGLTAAVWRAWRSGQALGRTTALPFGAALCLGAALVWVAQALG